MGQGVQEAVIVDVLGAEYDPRIDMFVITGLTDTGDQTRRRFPRHVWLKAQALISRAEAEFLDRTEAAILQFPAAS